jgi:hypothetical protein
MSHALYADENFEYGVVEELRALGYDVRTVQEAGRCGLDDPTVLADATAEGRVVLSHNRKHFWRLHANAATHAGIVACTEDDDWPALAGRIHARLAAIPDMTGRYEVIVRPNPSRKRTP